MTLLGQNSEKQSRTVVFVYVHSLVFNKGNEKRKMFFCPVRSYTRLASIKQ